MSELQSKWSSHDRPASKGSPTGSDVNPVVGTLPALLEPLMRSMALQLGKWSPVKARYGQSRGLDRFQGLTIAQCETQLAIAREDGSIVFINKDNFVPLRNEEERDGGTKPRKQRKTNQAINIERYI